MGREIRRVTLDWEHPRRENGSHQPLYDEDYESARQEWLDDLQAWLDGTHPDLEDKPDRNERMDYWEWSNNPPDREYYRSKWDSDPVGYQIYETVSEGTPVSPVFANKEEMKNWLIAEGHSEYAADEFIKVGWILSFAVIPGKGMASNIDIFDLEKDLKKDN